jgi:NAD-dependent dihydropyrimidine dehydrogenase PreA subunit
LPVLRSTLWSELATRIHIWVALAGCWSTVHNVNGLLFGRPGPVGFNCQGPLPCPLPKPRGIEGCLGIPGEHACGEGLQQHRCQRLMEAPRPLCVLQSLPSQPVWYYIGGLMKLLDVAEHSMDSTIIAKYRALTSKASDCIRCFECEERCPSDVPVVDRMERAIEVFAMVDG